MDRYDDAGNPMVVEDPKLQEAIDLINDYSLEEFEHFGVREGDDLTNIGVMYTTDNEYVDDEGFNHQTDLQVSIDLINPAIKFYIDDQLVYERSYSNLDQLISEELEYLNWDDLYSQIVDCLPEEE